MTKKTRLAKSRRAVARRNDRDAKQAKATTAEPKSSKGKTKVTATKRKQAATAAERASTTQHPWSEAATTTAPPAQTQNKKSKHRKAKSAGQNNSKHKPETAPSTGPCHTSVLSGSLNSTSDIMAAIEQATDPSLEAGPVTPRDDILTALGKPATPRRSPDQRRHFQDLSYLPSPPATTTHKENSQTAKTTSVDLLESHPDDLACLAKGWTACIPKPPSIFHQSSNSYNGANYNRGAVSSMPPPPPPTERESQLLRAILRPPPGLTKPPPGFGLSPSSIDLLPPPLLPPPGFEGRLSAGVIGAEQLYQHVLPPRSEIEHQRNGDNQVASTFQYNPRRLQQKAAEVAHRRAVEDQMLKLIWLETRGDQKPLPGCGPYIFRLPLEGGELDWDNCIGGEQDLRAVERLLGGDGYGIISAVTLYVREHPEPSSSSQHESNNDAEELGLFQQQLRCNRAQTQRRRELVLLPRSLGTTSLSMNALDPATAYRLNEAYNLCCDNYYTELRITRRNIPLVGFLEQRFTLMNQAARMALMGTAAGVSNLGLRTGPEFAMLRKIANDDEKKATGP